MSDERPKFRPAEWVTEEDVLAAFESDDPERIRLALIDGSRCLDAAWVFPHAWRYVRSNDSTIRWAAVFAMGQARSALADEVLTGTIWEHDDSPVLVLTRLAWNDAESHVRHLAAQVLGDLVFELASRVRKERAPTEA